MRAELGVLEGFGFNVRMTPIPLQHTADFREPRTNGLSQTVRMTGKPPACLVSTYVQPWSYCPIAQLAVLFPSEEPVFTPRLCL